MAIELARRLGRPVKWVETRSENLVAMPHGRGQVQYVELGLAPRRHDHRFALSDGRRRRCVRRVRGSARHGHHTHDGARRVPHPEDHLRERRRHHEHDADRRVPGCRSTRGGGVPRTDRRHGGRRAPHRSGRAAPAKLPPARGVPLHDADGHHVRQRRLRRRAHGGVASRRLRRAARRAGGATPPRGSAPPRDRHRRLRRGDGQRLQRVRRCRGRGRRHHHGTGGNLGPRPGPPDVVRDDRRRPARRAARVGPARPVRHRARAARRRDRRLPVAPTRRQRGPRSNRSAAAARS